LLALAQDDWRELLCKAEYSLSSRKWGLKDKAPKKYEAFVAKEQAAIARMENNHDHWREVRTYQSDRK
jgi:hypothetical protein